MLKITNKECSICSEPAKFSFFFLFLITAVLYSPKATAQGDLPDKKSGQLLLNNFSKDVNSIVYWQRVYETTLSKTELIDLIIESGYFDEIDMTEEKLVCRLRPYEINIGYHGYSLMDVSAYITRSIITGTVVFDFKPQRYRATVKNICFINNTEDYLGQISSLETQILTKRQDVRMPFFRVESELLDKDFTTKTSFIKLTEDW